MNLTQLQATLAANKPVVVGVAAAGVAGLAYVRSKKVGDAGTDPAGKAAASPVAAPSYSSGGQVAGYGSSAGGGYDSSASDLYGALSPQLQSIQQSLDAQTSAKPPTPVPLASQLYNPTYSGNYVRDNTGAIVEVENDGSLYGLTMDNWNALWKRNADEGGVNKPNVTQIGSSLPVFYNLESNLSNKPARGTPAATPAAAAAS